MCYGWLVMVAVVMHQSPDVESSCSFPLSWRGRWWREYNGSYTWTRIYYEDRERNDRMSVAESKSNRYTCEDMEEVVQGYHYYVRHREDDVDVKECVKVSVPKHARLMVQTSIEIVLFSCNFGVIDPGSVCEFVQDLTAGQRWKLHGTTSQSSGRWPLPRPRVAGDDHYLYMEAVGRARVFTPLGLPHDGSICVQFGYIFAIFPNEMDSLRVNRVRFRSTGTRQDSRKDWEVKNVPRDKWARAVVTVQDFTQHAAVEFEIYRTSNLEGVIAIDKIIIQKGECETVLVDCDFDSKQWCGFKQEWNDDLDWRLLDGPTTSSSTGPQAGYGGSGYYLYVDADANAPANFSARITTPKLQYTGDACLRFVSHMHGADVNRLEVYVQRASRREVLGVTVGEQGDVWHESAFNVTVQSVQDAVGFEAFIGLGYRGDIAIDDVSVTTGKCRVGKTIDPRDFTAEKCASDPDYSALYASPLKVLVKYPFDFANVSCPLAQGVYHVAVYEDSKNTFSCAMDRHSAVTVEDSTITVQACLRGSSYGEPFRNVQLHCVGDLTSEVFGSTEENGRAFIVFIAENTVAMFYTVRWRDTAQGIDVSLQGNHAGTLTPRPERRYNSSGVQDQDFFHYFAMKPASCNDLDCKNGGTCDDTYGFCCSCPAKFTGAYCETEGSAADGAMKTCAAGSSTTLTATYTSPSTPDPAATTSTPGAGATTSTPGAGATTSTPGAGATTSTPGAGATTSTSGAGATTSTPGAGAGSTTPGAGTGLSTTAGGAISAGTSSSSSEEEEENSGAEAQTGGGGSNVGAAVGGAVAGVIVLAALIAGLLYMRQKKKCGPGGWKKM